MKLGIGPIVGLVLLSAVPIVGSCTQTEHKLGAGSTGDLSYELADRRRPDLEQVDGCGAIAFTPELNQRLPRGPYLQQVTDHSALVVFTTIAAGEQLVEVTLPTGESVASVAAVNDETARPAGGAWQAVAHVEGLEPSTLYCYSVPGTTERAGFRTAPRAGDTSQPIRLIAFGDSGSGGEYQAAVRDQMFTVPFDMIVHVGDIAYDSGTLGQLESQFFDVYRELLESFPVFPVAGNHDYGTAAGAPLREAFELPENGAPEGVESWYSFDWGNVHFVALDTERIGDVQAAWLDSDLAATDKPWKIVMGHRPPYSSGEHGSNGAFRTHFVPQIEKHHVQLVLTGHDHDYERTQPLAGTTYIVTGGGGRSTRPVGSSDFTAFAEDVLHFVQIEIYENELFLHAIDGEGHEFDSARLELTSTG